MVQWGRIGHHAPAQDVSLAAAALGVADAVAVTVLSYLEHNRSVRPSTVLSLYLFVSVVFDAVQCRTLWIVDAVHPLAALASISLASRLVVLLLELQSKSSFLVEDADALGPEATSGVISRVLLWWLNPLLARGYRTILSNQSLDNLDPLLRSKPLLHRMQHNWRRQRTSGKHALLRTIVFSLKVELAYGALPRAANTAAKVSQPFLITKVIDYVQKQGTSEEYSKNIGYTLVLASFLVYLGLPVSNLCRNRYWRSSSC